MKILLLFLLVVHGLIHLLGFVKAFELAPVTQLSQPISRTAGGFWLLATILFVCSALLFLLRLPSWWIPSAAGIILSQVLIVVSWTDAKFGTVANILLLLPVLAGFMNALPSSYIHRFTADVQMRLGSGKSTSLLTEQDVLHLPPAVQKYLRFTGSIGKPKVFNFKALMKGEMRRTIDGDWQEITAWQYNFFDDPARLFYIESSMFGIPFDGYHAYIGNEAVMQIKIASLFEIVDARGEKMNQGETVTMFNDMCLMAPATLIAPSIRWEVIDSLTVRGIFTNRGNTISAVLTFDPSGALKNFVSNDRFLSEDGKAYLSYPWSTPVGEFKEYGGRKAASYGEAIWQTPKGEFIYGKFGIAEIEYNCDEMRK